MVAKGCKLEIIDIKFSFELLSITLVHRTNNFPVKIGQRDNCFYKVICACNRSVFSLYSLL